MHLLMLLIFCSIASHAGVGTGLSGGVAVNLELLLGSRVEGSSSLRKLRREFFFLPIFLL